MLAAWILFVCVTTLVAAGVIYGDAVTLGGLRTALRAAGPADTSILARTPAPPRDVVTLDASVRPVLTEVLGPGGGEVDQVARSDSMEIVGRPTVGDADRTLVASYAGIERHAELAAGHWPVSGGSPIEAAISESAAGALGLHLGDRLTVVDPLDQSTRLDLEIAALWRPNRADPYWLANPLELDGVETHGSETVRGPLVVAPADLAASTIRQLDVQWRARPDVEAFRVEWIDGVRTGITALRDRLGSALPTHRDFTISTGLPALLATLGRSVLVTRSGIALLTVQFGVLAGYAVLLVGGMLLERRRLDTALLRSRGAGTGHVAALSSIEAFVLAVPAAVIGPWLAVVVVWLVVNALPGDAVGRPGLIASEVDLRVGAPALIGSAVAAAACALGLALPALASGANLAGARAALGRAAARTLPQRLGIDLALVALAGVAIWQLRLYGAPLVRDVRGSLGLDPLLVAAPAIGLLGGGVIATRAVPRAAEIAQLVLERRRDLVASLGARQLARRPLRYTRSALLLMLAAGLGTFAAVDAATWSRSQQDQAAYQAAADVRVVVPDYPALPAGALGGAYRSIPGVTTAMPVLRLPLGVGRAVREAPLLGLDPAVAARIVGLAPRTGGSGAPSAVDALGGSAPEDHTLVVPGRPLRLSVVLDDDIRAAPGLEAQSAPVHGDYPGVLVSAILRDGDGMLHRIEGGRATLQGPNQRVEIPLTVGGTGPEAIAVAYPVAIQAIEIVINPEEGTFVAGSVRLRGVASSESTATSDWTAVAFVPASSGWLWTTISSVFDVPPTSGDRLTVGAKDALFASSGEPIATYRFAPPFAEAAPLPAIVGTRFLEATGLGVGDEVDADVLGIGLKLRIAGSVVTFPPLDPAKPFVVVDGPSLELRRFLASGDTVEPAEWWLATAPDAGESVVTTLGEARYSAAKVIVRADLARSLSGDPVALGIVGALTLGSLAALAFAAVGFVVSATASVNERLGEFALLRALGLSVRALAVWLSLESAAMLAFGLLAGSLLGLAVAALVLPAATLTSTGAAAVPPPSVIVPWPAIVPYLVLGAALLGLVLVVVRRRLPAVQISSVLRAGDR
ncbi:MAG: FtsX-like permease family protein [Chloroflexi bacterium]|nr:MAG: FtsX-like permease family protein [Chloroflexota bacterium]